MKILGVSAFYHDSAAALVIDSKLVAAVEEERFTRIKHDNAFPFESISYCLNNRDLLINDLDCISYYEKPLLKLERILSNFVDTYPLSMQSFVKGIPPLLSEKIKIEFILRKKLGFKGKIHFIPHHLSHAAVTFYTSTFKSSAIATIDGVGEYDTTCLWSGKEKSISNLESLQFPNSLGLLYSTFTSFLGFKINEDEYKLMGLSAYGKPIYKNKIYKIVELLKDGSFQLDMSYFNFHKNDQMFSYKFEKLFGSCRKPSASITGKHKDLAASIQQVAEEIYFTILNHLYTVTKNENLCIGGGFGLNALANGKIYKNTPFKKVWIFGASGDNGGAVGAALFTNYNIYKKPRKFISLNLNLGSKYSNKNIEDELKKYPVIYRFIPSQKNLIQISAELLAQNKVLGWFQDRMEFGPRALGMRSILANPKPSEMKERVNRVKIRELFRPFAGIVLQDKAEYLFEIPKSDYKFPYMNFCFQVRKDAKSEISAIFHKDGSCRIQTVNSTNGMIFKLINQFYANTGVPCLLNTSFNLKGEPIVESPRQAIDDFMRSSMDALVMGNFLITNKV